MEDGADDLDGEESVRDDGELLARLMRQKLQAEDTVADDAVDAEDDEDLVDGAEDNTDNVDD